MKLWPALAVGVSVLGWLPPAETAETSFEFESILRPARRLEIGSAAAGRLASINVERGDRVAVGQLLAELVSTIERADLELIRARAESDTGVRIAAVQHERTRRRREQFELLFRDGIVSPEELEAVRDEEALSELVLGQAREDRAHAQLELARARARVEDLRITSPIDGVVVERQRDAGEVVNRDSDDVILELAQLDPLIVDVRVPQGLFGRIRAGDEVVVRPEAPLQRDLAGAVAFVDPLVDPVSRSFRARIRIPNPDHAVPAGLGCTVTFAPGP